MLRSLLVDFNSYFASVEQQELQQLRGKPIAVVPLEADSTCCIAASYEAKAFGVKTGTRVRDAKRMCPGIQLVLARHELYVHYHQLAVELVERVTPIRRVLSIDEMECELTGTWQSREKAIAIAQKIKRTLMNELGECMRTSIGIAPNTLLAKLASNMRKPDGLTILEEADIPSAIIHLSPKDINGIGPKLWKHLQAAGLTTMQELYAAPREQLRAVWGGIAGSEIYDLLRGQWQDMRVSPTRSISHSHVLPPELRNAQGARDVLHRLMQKAAMRLRKMDRYATGMGVQITLSAPFPNSDVQRWIRNGHFSESRDTAFLLHALEVLCAQNLPVHPLAVSMSLYGLTEVGQHNLSLFDDQAAELSPSPSSRGEGETAAKKRENLLNVVDKINRAYGKNKIYFASTHAGKEQAPLRIAFGHIPDIQTES